MNGLRHAPEINGVVYSWSNLQVNINGTLITGITKVNYKDEQEIESIYGAGQRPIGRGYGRITSSASMTLLRDEVETIRTENGGGRLQDIAPFDIIVQFIPVDGKAMITHRIRGAQFKNDGVDASEGETGNQIDFDLIVSQIEWK